MYNVISLFIVTLASTVTVALPSTYNCSVGTVIVKVISLGFTRIVLVAVAVSYLSLPNVEVTLFEPACKLLMFLKIPVPFIISTDLISSFILIFKIVFTSIGREINKVAFSPNLTVSPVILKLYLMTLSAWKVVLKSVLFQYEPP